MDKLKTENIIRKKKKEIVPTLDIRASGCLLSHYPQGVTDEAVNNIRDVFERRTSTGSEALSLFICLDANKLVLLSFFSLLKTIYPRISTEPLPNDAKSPLPVDVRPSKTLLLKLPIASGRGSCPLSIA